MTLCNKDQIDILHSLRESVNEDKAALAHEAGQLKTRLAEVEQKNRMQLDQINGSVRQSSVGPFVMKTDTSRSYPQASRG